MHCQMDRSWVHNTLFPTEYVNGVKQFMDFIKEKFGEDAEILCPCTRCLNQKYLHQPTVKNHILMNGMDCTYTRWVHHGEDISVHVNEVPASILVFDIDEDSIGVAENDNNGVDRLDILLRELQTAQGHGSHDSKTKNGNNDGNRQSSFLKNLIKEAKCQLYPGCTKFSKFSFVAKLLHMKSFYRITNSALSAFVKLLVDAFPEFNTLPTSYHEPKNIIKELGLGYESIHVCYNNCILFQKDYSNHDNCPVCGLSRWKDPQRKKIPQKVLRHFPLVPRLQRLFVTKEGSEQAHWHKLKR
ncbi:unnamed protein product [Miscanthus lutarioriparius]|uniref:Transposase-associated domain-containing protein n=1 Tax=Miscanthus lutarioriparius TaxID=422564 RepID=A0A811S0K9_9POAL|nr:unnamed protein product [Miscanthus lutarioriparius]